MIGALSLEIMLLRSYFLFSMAPGTRSSLFGLLGFALILTLVLAPTAQAKRIVGTNSANVLKGTNAPDEMFGRKGKDVLIGFAGADYVYGDGGDDILLGEAGNDRLWGGGRDDTIDGGAGGDRIWPGWGTDVVHTGPGNDIINAGENDMSMDSVDCGDGVDRVVINRRDKVFNCETVVRLRGGGVPGDFSHQAEATSGDDVLGRFTWYEQDFVDALAGSDYLNGHGKADMLWGNLGDDRLDGDNGPDLLLGGPGDDTIWGEDGLDRIWAGPGFDILWGDDRDDELMAIENDGVQDRIHCGAGRDRVVLRPNDWVAPRECERVIWIAR